MRNTRLVLLTGLLIAGAQVPATAQVCHDWDGDEVLAGWDCATAADCEDLSWNRRPGAAEQCDGLLDQTCDTYCDEVGRYGRPTDLVVEDLPEAVDGCAALMDSGFLSISQRVVGHTGSPYDSLIYARG